jgi:hypothetical protein
MALKEAPMREGYDFPRRPSPEAAVSEQVVRVPADVAQRENEVKDRALFLAAQLREALRRYAGPESQSAAVGQYIAAIRTVTELARRAESDPEVFVRALALVGEV